MDYMLVNDEMKIANEWKRYAGYTVRPQASMVNFYEQYIYDLDPGDQTLLYGGTPEVRALYRRMNFPITIIDHSAMMVNAMGRVIHTLMPIASNEEVVISDWLTPPIFNHQFKLIISDDAINMVEWKQFDNFLSHVYHYLEDNALFLCHLLIKPDDCLINKTIDDVLEECTIGEIKSPYELASRINYLFYDYNSYCMGWQNSINNLKQNELMKISEFLDFKNLFKHCNSYFFCPPRECFEELIDHYFQIEMIFYSSEQPFCMYEPIYVLRKK